MKKRKENMTEMKFLFVFSDLFICHHFSSVLWGRSSSHMPVMYVMINSPSALRLVRFMEKATRCVQD